jgi:hypothetical protein
MIYLIQAITIIFAYALAKHDAPAVSHFENWSATPKEIAVFHRYNVWIKGCYCFVIFSIVFWLDTVVNGINAGLVSAGWIYLLFDPILNISRTQKRKWDYLGMNDADGRFWNGLFTISKGKSKFRKIIYAAFYFMKSHVGKIKAAILFLLIILANIFL